MLYRPVYGTDTAVPSRRDGRVKVSVPAMGVSVWKAERRADAGAGAPVLLARAPGSGADFSGRAKISGAVLDDRFAQVTAAWRLAGDSEWTKLGTDDSAPFAVYHDVSSLPTGSLVEYRLVAKDLRGRYAVATTSGLVGTKGTDAEGPGDGAGPVTQPANASVPGSHNSEMGCPGDWQPDCDQAQLTRDPDDDIWKRTIVGAGRATTPTRSPSTSRGTRTTGWAGAPNGGDIGYTAPGGDLTFFYDHRTKNIQNTAQGDLVAAAGSFQSEQGCAADWSPGLPAGLVG